MSSSSQQLPSAAMSTQSIISAPPIYSTAQQNSTTTTQSQPLVFVSLQAPNDDALSTVSSNINVTHSDFSDPSLSQFSHQFHWHCSNAF